MTRCEYEIFERYADEIVKDYFLRKVENSGDPESFNVIELGAGDGRKTKLLLDAMSKCSVKCKYMPIDISKQAIADLFDNVWTHFESYSKMTWSDILADYETGLNLVEKHISTRNIVLFVGSSIGNFDHQSSVQFLRDIKARLNRDDMLLIGFDLVKSHVNEAIDDEGRREEVDATYS